MKKETLRVMLLVILFAGIDQLTKLLIIKNFINIPYGINTGIAFSIKIPQLISIFGSIILLLAVLYLVKKELNLSGKLSQLSISLILAGGLGNLIDRVFEKGVIDFISIWKYPSFNIADAFITVGIFLIIIFYKRMKKF